MTLILLPPLPPKFGQSCRTFIRNGVTVFSNSPYCQNLRRVARTGTATLAVSNGIPEISSVGLAASMVNAIYQNRQLVIQTIMLFAVFIMAIKDFFSKHSQQEDDHLNNILPKPNQKAKPHSERIAREAKVQRLQSLRNDMLPRDGYLNNILPFNGLVAHQSDDEEFDYHEEIILQRDYYELPPPDYYKLMQRYSRRHKLTQKKVCGFVLRVLQRLPRQIARIGIGFRIKSFQFKFRAVGIILWLVFCYWPKMVWWHIEDFLMVYGMRPRMFLCWLITFRMAVMGCMMDPQIFYGIWLPIILTILALEDWF